MKIYNVPYLNSFILNGKKYTVFSTFIRVSNTSIVIICIDEETKDLVQLDANTDVLIIE